MAMDLEALMGAMGGAPEGDPMGGLPPSEQAPTGEPDASMGGFDLPVPGESLTADPGSMPFEQPPQFTSIDKAVDHLFERMTKQSTVDNLLRVMDTGMPVGDLAKPIAMNGAGEGLWNVDMAMNLVEPIMVILAGIAHMAGVTPVMMAKPKENLIDTKAFTKVFKGADVGAKQANKTTDADDIIARKDKILEDVKGGGLLSKEGVA